MSSRFQALAEIQDCLIAQERANEDRFAHALAAMACQEAIPSPSGATRLATVRYWNAAVRHGFICC